MIREINMGYKRASSPSKMFPQKYKKKWTSAPKTSWLIISIELCIRMKKTIPNREPKLKCMQRGREAVASQCKSGNRLSSNLRKSMKDPSPQEMVAMAQEVVEMTKMALVMVGLNWIL